MSITLLLVGYQNKNITYTFTETVITHTNLKLLLISKGFNKELFNSINFFCDNKNIKKCNIELNSDKIIKIFTANNKTKEELITFFEFYGQIVNIQPVNETIVNETIVNKTTVNETTVNETTVNKYSETKLDDTKLNEINQKSILLFQDEDFKTLIRIYKNKPELLKIFYQYISAGDIIENDYSTEIDISTNLKVIQDFGLNLSDEIISNALYKTGNHLNLTLRYLLFNH